MSDDSSHSSEDSGVSWISSFCQEPQNQFFCEIERAFIEDGFNLYGLRPYVKHFKESLDIILDNKSHDDDGDQEEYQENAEMLYGLIHARYIITMHGMETMSHKFYRKEFGECPRMLCEGQAVLPLGTKDEPHQDSVRIFCPKCQQVYNPSPVSGGGSLSGGSGGVGGGIGNSSGGNKRPRQSSSASSSGSSSTSSGSGNGIIRMDGAFIGTTFPHLFLMTFDDKVPPPPREVYVPRVFGFRLHSSNKSRVSPVLLPAPTTTITIASTSTSMAAASSSSTNNNATNPPAPPAACVGNNNAGAAAAAAGGGGAGKKKGQTEQPIFSSDDDGAGGGASHKRRRTEEGGKK